MDHLPNLFAAFCCFGMCPAVEDDADDEDELDELNEALTAL